MASVGDKDRVLQLTRRFLAPHRVEVWDDFGTQLVIGRREGYRLWDLSGHELLDLQNAALERLEEALTRVKDVDRPVPQRHRTTATTRP
jgi:hypothetical protein